MFWTVPEAPLAERRAARGARRLPHLRPPGLPPGPIATPSLASIDAALAPDTEDKYIYFLAIPDGGGAHVFAKTLDEHNAHREEYGYT